METTPLVGTFNPAHKPSNVVFPLPDGPTIAKEFPCFALKVTSSKTVSDRSADLYIFVRFWT
jgi:hypothetical protein